MEKGELIRNVCFGVAWLEKEAKGELYEVFLLVVS